MTTKPDDTNEDGRGEPLWTITRKLGGIKHTREIAERFIPGPLLAELKRLVRA
mgnify:CR=1 FL=1